MLVETALVRLVVIGCDDEHRIGAGALGMHGEVDGFMGIVRARAGDDRRAARSRLDADLDDPLVFVMAQRRRFARGPDRNQAFRPFGHLPVDEGAESRLVERTRGVERGNKRGHGTAQRRTLNHVNRTPACIRALTALPDL